MLKRSVKLYLYMYIIRVHILCTYMYEYDKTYKTAPASSYNVLAETPLTSLFALLAAVDCAMR